MENQNESLKCIEERRVVAVCVGMQTMLQIMTDGVRVVTTGGVPEGAVPMYAYNDYARNCMYVLFTHPSFEPVPLGVETPVLHDAEITVARRDDVWCPRCGESWLWPTPGTPASFRCSCGHRFGVAPVPMDRWRHVELLDLRTEKPE